MRRARDAEIEHLGAGLAGEEDVRRFDIAMHHPTPMRVGQRIGHAAHELHRALRRGQPALREGLAHILAVQPLHGDIDALRRQAGVVHGDDVAVVEAGRSARFVEKQTIERNTQRCFYVELQSLHRHGARKQRVPGFVDGAQATIGQARFECITADVRQRGPRGYVAMLGRQLQLGAQRIGPWGRQRGHGGCKRSRRNIARTTAWLALKEVKSHAKQLKRRAVRRSYQKRGISPRVNGLSRLRVRWAAVRHARRAARAATSAPRRSPAVLSSTPFTYLWPSVPPKLLANSTASLMATR